MTDSETVVNQIVHELKDVARQLVYFGHAEYLKQGRGACLAQFKSLEDAATCAAPAMSYKKSSVCNSGLKAAVDQYDPVKEVIVLIEIGNKLCRTLRLVTI
jgi:hypothetical protein